MHNTDDQDRTSSRKESTATFEHLGLTHMASNSTILSDAHHSTHTQDTIIPLSTFDQLIPRGEENSRPEIKSPQPTHQHNIFSTFRTQISVPFSFFSRKSFNVADLEAQTSQSTRRGSVHNPHTSHNATQPTVKTNIWSGHAHSSATAPPSAREESIDPLPPRLGSRAYRERERRERAGETQPRGKEHIRVIADEVIVSQTLDRTEEISPVRNVDHAL